MGRFGLELNSTVIISFHLLLFSLFFICNYLPVVTGNSTRLLSDFPDMCNYMNCGQGTCKPSNATGFGVECECKPNWATNLWFYSCIFPNCTLDMFCGNPFPPPPLPNISFNPCDLTWCGDGTCINNANGSTSCQCSAGSSNLYNNPSFICLQQCNFGADCQGLGLGLSSPPPLSKSGSPGNGPGTTSSCSRNLLVLTMVLLAAISILPWS